MFEDSCMKCEMLIGCVCVGIVHGRHLVERRCTLVEISMTTSQPMKTFFTENDAKHTFQAPCSCFNSGLTIDLLLFITINVSID